MPIVEEPFSPQHIHFDPLEPRPPLYRAGYFSTSTIAPVLQLRVDWAPDEETYWETAITVALGNPQIFTRQVLPILGPGWGDKFSTQGRWIHDNLPCRFDRNKLWRYTFYAPVTERRYTRAITKEMWNQLDSQDWVVYVGAIARSWRFGNEEHETGRTDISGQITVAPCRRIDDKFVKIESVPRRTRSPRKRFLTLTQNQTNEILARICASMDRNTLVNSSLVCRRWKKTAYTHLWRRLDGFGFLALLKILAPIHPATSPYQYVGDIQLSPNWKEFRDRARLVQNLSVINMWEYLDLLESIHQRRPSGQGDLFPTLKTLVIFITIPDSTTIESYFRHPNLREHGWARQGLCAHELLMASSLVNYTIVSHLDPYSSDPDDYIPCPLDKRFVHVLPSSLLHLSMDAPSVTDRGLYSIISHLPHLVSLTVPNRRLCSIPILRLLSTFKKFKHLTNKKMNRYPAIIPILDHDITQPLLGSNFRTITFGDNLQDAIDFASEPGFPSQLATLVIDIQLSWYHSYDQTQLHDLVCVVAKKNPLIKSVQIREPLTSAPDTAILRELFTSPFVHGLTHIRVKTVQPLKRDKDGSVFRSIAQSLPNLEVFEIETDRAGHGAPLNVLLDFVINCPCLRHLGFQIDTGTYVRQKIAQLPRSKSIRVLAIFQSRLELEDLAYVTAFLLAIMPRGFLLDPSGSGCSPYWMEVIDVVDLSPAYGDFFLFIGFE